MKITKILVGVLSLGVLFLFTGNSAYAETVQSSEMAVCSYDKQSNCMVNDYTTVYAPTAGKYSMRGYVGRGTHSNDTCQAHEDFKLYINGSYAVTSYDKNNCEPGSKNVYTKEGYGYVWLKAGNNNIKMSHAHSRKDYGNTGEAESVSVSLLFSKSDPIDGKCGSSNGKVLYQKPTTGLCSVGVASPIAGTWNWTCSGKYGGKNDSCSARKPRCGDNKKELNEQCDDGNNTNGDGCSSACTIEKALIKIDKNDNDNKDDKQTVQKGNNATFKIKVTNNGAVLLRNVSIVDPKVSACNRLFTTTLAPGGSIQYTCTHSNVSNAYLNTATVSALTVSSGILVKDTDTSKVNIIAPRCGDEVKDAGEQCDDGNNTNGDGCSSACTIEKASIKIDKNDNDNKDDKQTVLSGGEANFKIKVTNMGQIALKNIAIKDALAPGCDKLKGGILLSGQSFSYVCTDKNITNSYLNKATVSAVSIDEASTVTDSDTSSVNVKNDDPLPFCGDGKKELTEQCDDGNNINGDGCSSTCTIETPTPFCGDGIVKHGEQCDDGNTANGDGCSSACTIETPTPDPKPDPKPKKKSKCNGVIGNYIWNDIDRDGIQDGSEKGIENIRMKLKWAGEDNKFGNSDDEVYRTDTNHNGHYYFENLCEGDYKVYVKDEDVDNLKQTYDPDGDEDNKTKVELDGNKDSHSKADFGYAGKVLPVTGSGAWAILIATIVALMSIWIANNPKAKTALLRKLLPKK
ncbi:DUF4215 domain-containing protein [Patescibacteria group bacterium]